VFIPSFFNVRTLAVDRNRGLKWSREGFVSMMASTHPLANLNLLEAGQFGRQQVFPPDEVERRAYARIYDKVSSTEGGIPLLARVRVIGAASGLETERDVIQRNTAADVNVPDELRGKVARFLMEGTNWEFLRSLTEPTRKQAKELVELNGEYNVCKSFVDGMAQLIGGGAVVRKLADRAMQMNA
jgi:hypothetical protein